MKRTLLCALILALLLSLLTTGISCNKAKSIISFNPSSLDFTATEGASSPPSQLLAIWNSGNGTLKWSISGDAAWLKLGSTTGSSISYNMNAVTVAVDTNGMRAGGYSASITISASGATNTPQTVPVSLTLGAPTTWSAMTSGTTFIGLGGV